MSEKTGKTRFINASRRGFLQGAAVAGGAAAAGAASAADLEPTVDSPVEQPTGSKGYRRTEHVKKYYQRARF